MKEEANVQHHFRSSTKRHQNFPRQINPLPCSHLMPNVSFRSMCLITLQIELHLVGGQRSGQGVPYRPVWIKTKIQKSQLCCGTYYVRADRHSPNRSPVCLPSWWAYQRESADVSCFGHSFCCWNWRVLLGGRRERWEAHLSLRSTALLSTRRHGGNIKSSHAPLTTNPYEQARDGRLGSPVNALWGEMLLGDGWEEAPIRCLETPRLLQVSQPS